MSKEGLSAKDFIGHILEAAEKVLHYTKSMNREQFLADTLTQDAVIRNIEIIGEAMNNLLEADPTIVAKYPSIPFAQIYGMRNRVAHGYFSVSLAMVWDSVEEDIPDLRRRMQSALEELREGSS